MQPATKKYERFGDSSDLVNFNGSVCRRLDVVNEFRACGHKQLFAEQMAWMCKRVTEAEAAKLPTRAEVKAWQESVGIVWPRPLTKEERAA